MEVKQMNSDYNLLHELENLYHFLHGAHSLCDHENSGAAFHQACHKLDDIINNFKISTASNKYKLCPLCSKYRLSEGICWEVGCKDKVNNTTSDDLDSDDFKPIKYKCSVCNGMHYFGVVCPLSQPTAT